MTKFALIALLLFGFTSTSEAFYSDDYFDVSDSENTSRIYDARLTSSEKEDISYIVNTLGMASLGKITKNKSALKRAGKRVDNVHPLNFLAVIFSDDKMRTAIHAMKDRKWVWDGFYDGIRGSLSEESAKDNLKEAFVEDFCHRLNIDAHKVLPLVQIHEWNNFIKTLLKLMPRSGDADRYDM